MKGIKLISAIILFFVFMQESRSQNRIDNNDLITVSVTNNYSHKRELVLQDFMDVEYIALETNDDFVNQGVVLDIGKEFVLVKNSNRINDGNIFLYDRTGKAIRKINCKGQGSEEYISLYGTTLDEENREMFVNDILGKKIIVYDFYGNFKRSFKKRNEESSGFYKDIFNYDQNHLICYEENHRDIPFVIISKQDGHIVQEIKIPFKDKKFLGQIKKEGSNSQALVSVGPGPYYSLLPFNDDWILSELSSDTIFSLSPDNCLHPFIARTPSIQSMDPDVYLIVRMLTDHYYFMETIKNVYNWSTQNGFPKTYFMYDTNEQSFSEYTLYNGDFTTKKEIFLSIVKLVNKEIQSCYTLQAYQLVESYHARELKGKLKEIASTLNEESNPIIMLVKSKK